MRRLLAGTTVLLALLWPAGALAGAEGSLRGGAGGPFTLAVIGDTPYGDEQLAAFPDLVANVNGDREVDFVLHLGDIKSGSSPCTDDYFLQIRSLFETFADPLVYTPGDNEWTDCHRATAGAYLPTERLSRLREVFYPEPGTTLGGREAHVLTQGDEPGFEPYVENQLWMRSRVVFSTILVVGSNNDLEPWFGEMETEEQRAERLAEYASRLEADLAWLERAFALARAEDARGVVVAMQADMWDAFSIASGAPLDGFDPIVARLAELASELARPVLVLEGDSHLFLADGPLASGSPIHGVETPAPNVTRIVVQGETVSEWLRLTVDPRSPEVFSFGRVQP